MQPFIDHINESEKKLYVHVSCLDITIRDRPQPEVLYRNNEDGSEIVVERKNFMWPLCYAELHRAEHHFFDLIIERIQHLTEGRPFAIALPPTPTIDRKLLKAYADQIAEEIATTVNQLAPGQGFTGAFNGHRYKFWHQWDSERDNGVPDTGLMIEIVQRPESIISNPHNLPSELLNELQKVFSSCVDKFREYSKARCVLLIEPHGQLKYLAEDWWVELLSIRATPKTIDEIWISHHEFIHNMGEEWEFERIYPVS